MKTTKFNLLFLSFLIVLPSFLYAQRILRGLVVDDYSGSSVEAAAVFISGIMKNTVSSGRFEIDVTSFYQAGKQIDINIYHDDYGINTLPFTFPADMSGMATFRIKRDPRMAFLGVVKDRYSGASLEGVEVTISSASLLVPSPVVKTDRFGAFKIVIAKNAFSERIRNARLLFHDPGQVYKDFQETYDLGELHRVELEKGKSPVYKHKVKSFIEVEFEAPEGMIINIKASGTIEVGRLVGTSGPDGKENGVLGLSLAAYNIVRNINHAALMYKLEGNQSWKFCGSGCQFVAPRDGKQKIYFEINDNNQYDNYGAYDVEISVAY